MLPRSGIGLKRLLLAPLPPAGNEKAGDMMTKAQDDWYAAGGPDADKRVANVLNGLGFKQDQWSKSCSEFSGGWQVRAGAGAAGWLWC